MLRTGGISPGAAGEGAQRRMEFEPPAHPRSAESAHQVPDLFVRSVPVPSAGRPLLPHPEEGKAPVLSLREQAGTVRARRPHANPATVRAVRQRQAEVEQEELVGLSHDWVRPR